MAFHRNELSARRAGVTRTINAGFAHHQAGRLDRAQALYRKALAKDPDHAEALHLLGLIAYQQGRIETAIELIERALPELHDLPEAHLNLGNALREAGRLTEAADRYRRAIALDPDYGMAHCNLARTLNDQNLFAAGLESSRRAVELIPDFLGAQVNCAAALMGLERFAEAEVSLRRVIELRPDRAETHYGLGRLLATLGRLDEAVASFRQVLALEPARSEAHFDLGSVLQAQNRLDEAVASYERALVLKPDKPEAYINLGVALTDLGKLDEAVASYGRALVLRPDEPEAYINLGVALTNLGKLDEAVASYQRALALEPGHARAYRNLGHALNDQGKLSEAIACFGRALALKVDEPGGLATWFHGKQRICDWSGYQDDEARTRIAIRGQASAGSAFVLLTLASTPVEQFECARKIAAKIAVPESAALPRRHRRTGARIRLGYLSADFHHHATAFLIAGLIEHHDRPGFEVSGYSYGTDDGSAIRTRLTGAFDRFVDIRGMPHRQAVELIGTGAIDILIDLKGFTHGARTAILAHRPAPIQVNYLGYPGTMGADFIDYIIVDRFVVPPDQQPFFTERLVHLPDCYQCNDDKRAIAECIPSRVKCGLPEVGFVFCCFNNSYKITPTFFDIWMRMLRGVPGSVLWMLGANPWARANLAREATVWVSRLNA